MEENERVINGAEKRTERDKRRKEREKQEGKRKLGEMKLREREGR